MLRRGEKKHKLHMLHYLDAWVPAPALKVMWLSTAKYAVFYLGRNCTSVGYKLIPFSTSQVYSAAPLVHIFRVFELESLILSTNFSVGNSLTGATGTSQTERLLRIAGH